MKVFQQQLLIATNGRGLVDIGSRVNEVVSESFVAVGLCHIFCAHTSASLLITENADARVHDDLEMILGRVAPDGDSAYTHRSEGPDDMPAHARSVLTDVSITVPVAGNQLVLGVWQGLYLWEHRTRPHDRRLVVTVSGSPQNMQTQSP
ncbi:MAG: YjbQ family protein [Gammaproteobacteria bacterium]|nr:YjbQ family protein [Gammaproteobacteria bacterium]